MDKVAEAISEALINIKDEYNIADDEIKVLATLISAVVKSNKAIRDEFYAGVQLIALKIKAILKEQEMKILKEMESDKKDDILN